jgi:hypothetical protein
MKIYFLEQRKFTSTTMIGAEHISNIQGLKLSITPHDINQRKSIQAQLHLPQVNLSFYPIAKII